uniref:FHF complex subunit HOOK-interacting protein 1B isoform X2 n=1 Tax=Myxine glutinosa TaxID=7769 RepID=UPI00358F6C54
MRHGFSKPLAAGKVPKVLKILEAKPGSKTVDGSPPILSPDEVNTVRNNAEQMTWLLAREAAPLDGGLGPVLDFALSEDVLRRLLCWSRQCPDGDASDEARLALLIQFEILACQARQPLLCHKPVLQPLLHLLSDCTQSGSPKVESSLLVLLGQLCSAMSKNPTLLELVFHCGAPPLAGSNHSPPPCTPVFTLLISYIHRDGQLGQQARDAMLLVMTLSTENDLLGRRITKESDFCPVLASGLSGLYSSLPRKMEAISDDWHALQPEDCAGVPALVRFMTALDFCNAVLQVAHKDVKQQLVKYIYDGFLIPVLGPALHKSSVEELIASTAYLDLFLRSISEPSLFCAFLHFILLHQHDDVPVLDTLISRIASNSRLCMVSLALFRTLLDLNCEDVVLQLVFRYLIPCTHVMASQRGAVRDTDMYGMAAQRMLGLVPSCCKLDVIPARADKEEMTPEKGWVQPRSPDPRIVSPAAKTQTPMRRSFFSRQKSDSAENEKQMLPRRSESTESADATPPADRPQSEPGYLGYLRDIRQQISRRAHACRSWSAPYDGENPARDSVPPLPPVTLPPPPPLQQFGDMRENSTVRASTGTSNEEFDHADWNICLEQNCISVIPVGKMKKLSVGGDEWNELKGRQKEVPGMKEPLDKTVAATETNSGSCNGRIDRDGASRLLLLALSKEKGNVEANVVKNVHGTHVCEKDAQEEDNVEASTGRMQPTPERIADETSFLVLEGQGTEKQNNGTTLGPAVLVELESTGPTSGLSAVDELIEKFLENPLEQDAALLVNRIASLQAAVPEDDGNTKSADDGVQRGIQQEAEATDLNDNEDQVFGSFAEKSMVEGSVPSTKTQLHEKSSGHLVNLKIPSQLHAAPYTGPFVTVLFSKLENMLQNSLYVNLLLTGIIVQLASYPQPLLRSFLLNTTMVFQPSVKSLVQVLGTVKQRVESFAANYAEFPLMVQRAMQYLVARGKAGTGESPLFVPLPRRPEAFVKSKKPSLGELLLRHANSPSRARQAAQLALHHVRHAGAPPIPIAPNSAAAAGFAAFRRQQHEATRTKNAVYCALLLSEFVHELAAAAQEHSVFFQRAENS